MAPEEKKLKQREYQHKYDNSPNGKRKKRQWEKKNTKRRREYKKLKQREYRQAKDSSLNVDT